MNIEQIINEFIKDLQWGLRASYNSSSCLSPKQRNFLESKLFNFANNFLAENKRLKEVLKKYGQHLAYCEIDPFDAPAIKMKDERKCTCDFERALKGE